ncbi:MULTISPECIES: SDR family oxidoreductase [Sphingobium]|uniref:3-hydroxy-2-methylbutyryl-CoA dehydrogenase n=1 Tax=Sphingobium cupriresistens LL01 TaxID=1420583 RepID=A0A0J7XQH1_9SPHN|nr:MULTISPECIES: SDR family oxidoreductase [Sphingobium]KMS53308.1 3-hydroxy-2-methylbutyryl-CoA dehydrogenase [Sphingobium cupriresistens LL01]MBJ7376051.1 SDR family oxidoreductase [Sphingobium sp.]
MQITNGMAAIVTGGASGLGKASARALADAGMKVAIFDLNEEAGEAVASDIGGLFCKVNILDEDSVLAGFEKARAAHGQERALIHCAQVSKGGKTVSRDRETGGFKRFSTEDYAFSAMGILVASYRMASISAMGMAAVEPLNDDGERGSIVLTSSAAAQDGQVGQIAYGSLKAGVNGLVLPMARDLMDLGIRVNSVMPGIFATPPMLGVKDSAPQIFENLEKSVPFPKRLGKPEEFGSLIVELVRNSYFNGQNLRIDGAIRMPPR